MMQTISLPFDVVLPAFKTLKTKKLSCLYEEGKLRYIKCSSSEVIRTIYFAVRDEHWDTAKLTIQNERIEESEDSFSITYTSIHQLNTIQYKAEIRIEAEGNKLSFAVRGEALSSFQKNRIGLCVLHPVDQSKDKEVLITKPNGSTYTGQFPELISPHQPFKDVSQMSYKTVDVIETHLRFEGDIFETEDQRNWADATFKTYSTPLDLPFPVLVEKGTITTQKITLEVDEKGLLEKGAPIEEEQKLSFPKIGYTRLLGEKLTDKEIELLRQIPFDHYRVELFLFESNWKEVLEASIKEAKELDTKLELILFFQGNWDQQLDNFLNTIKANHFLVRSVLAVDTEQPATPKDLLSKLYKDVKKIDPQITVGYGTDGFFAELNRNRLEDMDFDFVSFGLNPQVHAFDVRSIIENLERLPDLIQTIRSFTGDKEIHISPITLKIRANEEKDYDERQYTAFGAFWTLSAIRNLSVATHLSFYGVKGYRGILKDSSSPLFEALIKLNEFKPKWVICRPFSSSHFLEPVIFENEHGERIRFEMNNELFIQP